VQLLYRRSESVNCARRKFEFQIMHSTVSRAKKPADDVFVYFITLKEQFFD
jgi:hypothetical protein